MVRNLQLARDLYNAQTKVQLKDICTESELKIIESNEAFLHDTLTECQYEDQCFLVSILCKEM